MVLYNNLTDDELLELLQADSQEALTVLFNRYWVKLLSVASHRLHDVALGEDCVQNVFISLWQRRKILHIKQSLSSYLNVSVKYQVIRHLELERKRKIENTDSSLLKGLSYTGATDDPLLTKELFDKLHVSIAELPSKCQIVFRMSREDGLSNKEISDRLKLSLKTVEAHMTKALKELKYKFNQFHRVLQGYFDLQFLKF